MIVFNPAETKNNACGSVVSGSMKMNTSLLPFNRELPSFVPMALDVDIGLITEMESSLVYFSEPTLKKRGPLIKQNSNDFPDETRNLLRSYG